MCAAGKVLAAGRVSETEVWRRGGWRSLADWVAQASGAKRGRAAESVEVASRLSDCPVAESCYATTLSLPIYPDLSDADVDRVAERVRARVAG